MIISFGQFLDNIRFTRLLLDQSVRYQQTLPMRFLDRLPLVPADDDEIIATYTGRVLSADIVADDQAAAVYEMGQLEFVTNVIPNIKIGRRVGQGMINRLDRLRSQQPARSDVDVWRNWETTMAQMCLLGVRESQNALACAMMMDSFNYERLGIKMANINWGMPSTFKATSAVLWSNVAATPVSDILAMQVFAQQTFGVSFDRVTLSTQDFINAAGTTQFRNLIQGLVNAPIGATTGAFDPREPRMAAFFSQMLAMEIERDDKTYARQNPDGSVYYSRVLPTGTVLLSRTSDDRNPATWDMANAPVTEAKVAGLVGDPDKVPSGEQFGPIGYFTGQPDLNPPNLKAWAVARCFPRRHNKWSSAVLKVA